MEGLEAALGRKAQENRRRKVTGDVEARICAIACSEPPEGASRWTMQAIADELIRLEVVDYITDTTVCEVMKKRNQAVARKEMVHSGSRSRIRGEDGGRAGGTPAPIRPLRPVVCIDETNKQLIKETRIPCEPGHPEKADSVYVRNGVADVFMISEPLAGRRETVVTQTRTALDFADILQYTSDTLYPRTEKARSVLH